MNRLCLPYRLSSLLLLLTTLLLSSCKPVVTFTGQSLLDKNGNEYGQLTWSITGEVDDEFQLTGVQIEPDIGAVDAEGTLKVYPTQTTTYRLTAYASGPNNTVFNTVRSVTIHIGPRVNYNLVTDTSLRACLKETGFTHLEQFDVIYCLDRSIRSLAGLEQFDLTRSVSLDNNAITNLTPLTQMPLLNSVSVSNNRLTSLDALANSSAIRNIVAYNNQITDPSGLAGMSQLLTLALDQNRISDATTLAGLPQLQGLSVARNQITNVAPLNTLKGLLALDVSHNGVTSGITALRTLTKASVIRSEGNGGVRCIDYASLTLALGPVVIFDKCKLF
ncbi:MAG TPA: hypothetical protein VM553_12230 [Dongiaceae bacterium]|nr:hypothetical protein [Dongiaceae bacterium]